MRQDNCKAGQLSCLACIVTPLLCLALDPPRPTSPWRCLGIALALPCLAVVPPCLCLSRIALPCSCPALQLPCLNFVCCCVAWSSLVLPGHCLASPWVVADLSCLLWLALLCISSALPLPGNRLLLCLAFFAGACFCFAGQSQVSFFSKPTFSPPFSFLDGESRGKKMLSCLCLAFLVMLSLALSLPIVLVAATLPGRAMSCCIVWLLCRVGLYGCR